MKIGILTFHCAINYGAVLQAYGLQEYLKSLGHEVYIIDYQPDYLKRPYRLFFDERIKGNGFWRNIRLFLREILASPIRYKRNEKFKRFCKQRLHLVSLDLQKSDNGFDLFVFGSDQIWNMEITENDSVFWGNAPAFKNKKLITYAASAGSVSILEKVNISQIKGWLSNFSSISVRENELSIYLNDKLDIKNQVVLDPVLLAGKHIFQSIVSSINIRKPYLLFFSLCGNDKALKFAKYQSKLMGLELIIMYSIEEAIKKNDVRQSLSPEEFISYFQNATYIITTSFHGTVFSILFEKNFIYYSYDKIISERISNLLKDLGIHHRIQNIGDEYKLYDIIDYVTVKSKLEISRINSINFLQLNLQNG